VWSGTGKRLATFTNSTLCTHFGLSGPSVLDISRYYLAAKQADSGTTLTINWAPGQSVESVDALLAERRAQRTLRALGGNPLRLPERLAEALCRQAGVDPADTGEHLSREKRRALATAVARCVLPVAGDRGYTYAEVTAGGVPLSEVRLDTMASRPCPGLHLAGEILDVDGRIGGFNFQWAWASGWLAGRAAADALAAPAATVGA
ncbi:MAG: NAD(P)/FAD-dependent oxidoreductase, partial [Phycisphaeraceae bacterium]|nr:NAD(P)/FAD-dependent oxidoreductase [Phycisphaeraceae bacterium]